MILLAVGANTSGRLGSAEAAVYAVPTLLSARSIFPVAGSFIYVSAPIGLQGQERYLNAALVVSTSLSPDRLLLALKEIEAVAGRKEGPRWGPRPLDLDLIAYGDLLTGGRGDRCSSLARGGSVRRGRLILPHPLMRERPFVIRPLVDIAPHWCHPVTRETVCHMWRDVCYKTAGCILARRDALLPKSR